MSQFYSTILKLFLGCLLEQDQLPNLNWSRDNKIVWHLWYCIFHQPQWNTNIIEYTCYTFYYQLCLSNIYKGKELGSYKTFFILHIIHLWIEELSHHFLCYNSGFYDDEIMLSRWIPKFINCNDLLFYSRISPLSRS